MMLLLRALLPACLLLAAGFISHGDCCAARGPEHLGCYHKNQLVQEGSHEANAVPVTYLNLKACENECKIAMPNAASPMKALGEGKCWCGYTQVNGLKADWHLCDLKCESDEREACGAEKNFLSVYRS